MEGPRIFVSYRRLEAAGYAISIVESIAREFGEQEVFQDLRRLQGGDDWNQEITAAIQTSKVMVVVIGPAWAGWTVPGTTLPALHREDDPVRREIETAIACRVALRPVLVGRATMPAAGDLPKSIAPLAAVQAIELSDSRWADDSRRLHFSIARALGEGWASMAAWRLRRIRAEWLGSLSVSAVLTIACVGLAVSLRTVSTWPVPPLVADAVAASLLWLLALAWLLSGWPPLRGRPPAPAAAEASATGSTTPPRPGRPSRLSLAAFALSALAAAYFTREPLSALMAGSWVFCATVSTEAGPPGQVQLLDPHARPVTPSCLRLDDDSGLKLLRRPHWYTYRPTHIAVSCGAEHDPPRVTLPAAVFDGTCATEVTTP
ncbi:MAG: toll/interleukin-1 receptor domain-containing protein [Burkholderiales bacterium]